MSSHYDDQMRLWLDGLYRPSSYDRDTVLRRGTARLTLSP
jgi:acyl-homoserine lactone acylase PvdQ